MTQPSKHAFQTTRLQFAPLVPTDAPALYKGIRTAPSVMKWSRQSHIDHSLEDTTKWIKELTEGMDTTPNDSPLSSEAGSKLVGMAFAIREIAQLDEQQTAGGNRGEDKIIGMTGIRLIKSELSVGEQFEIGYMFVPSSWGKGYASETVQGLLPWWFKYSKDYFDGYSGGNGGDGVDQDNVYAVVAKENTASLRIMEKCGFRVHGEGRMFENFDQVYI
ncbi:GNAT domain-containing protein [Aspergillus crustosus]